MADRREAIIEASLVLFRTQGFTGTGVKRILDDAGATLGSMYHYFPGGKDELAAEVLAHAGVYYAGVVAEKLAMRDDPAEAIEFAFRGAGRDLRRSGWADACPIETVALEVASTNEPLREACDAVFRSWLDGIAAWLVGSGIARSEADRLAMVILSALEGAFVLARTMQSTAPLNAAGVHMATLVRAAIDG